MPPTCRADASFDDLFAVVLPRQQGIVARAEKSDVLGRGWPAFGEGDLMVILQSATFFAPSAVGADKGALTAVASKDSPFDIIRDMPTWLGGLSSLRRGLRLGGPRTLRRLLGRARAFGGPVLTFALCEDELIERRLEQSRQIPRGVLLPREVPGSLDFAANAFIGGELDFIATKPEWLGVPHGFRGCGNRGSRGDRRWRIARGRLGQTGRRRWRRRERLLSGRGGGGRWGSDRRLRVG